MFPGAAARCFDRHHQLRTWITDALRRIEELVHIRRTSPVEGCHNPGLAACDNAVGAAVPKVGHALEEVFIPHRFGSKRSQCVLSLAVDYHIDPRDESKQACSRLAEHAAAAEHYANPRISLFHNFGNIERGAEL